MQKIKVTGTVVELDGDEMTRIIWADQGKADSALSRRRSSYYDLSIENRDKTNDQVTIDAAYAIKQHGVGVKCATITPDEARVKEFNLKEMWKIPNGTIRNILGGVIFREPIICRNVPRLVPGLDTADRHRPPRLRRPVQRHRLQSARQRPLTIKFDGVDGETIEKEVFKSPGTGVALAMYNLDDRISEFARATFNYGLTRRYPVYLSTKNTILKAYDGRFKDLFQEIYDAEFRSKFESARSPTSIV